MTVGIFLFYLNYFVNILNIIFRAVKMWPRVKTVAVFSRNNVNVEMRDGLSCALITRIKQINTVITAIVNTVIGNKLYRLHKPIQGFCITVQNIFDVLFGDRAHMSVNVSRYVHKYKRMLVLVYL